MPPPAKGGSFGNFENCKLYFVSILVFMYYDCIVLIITMNSIYLNFIKNYINSSLMHVHAW